MTDDDELLITRVALSLLVEPGDRNMGELVDTCGPVEALRSVLRRDVVPKLRDVTGSRLALGPPLPAAERAVATVARIGGRLITPEHDEWPTQVNDLRRISRDTGIDWNVWPPLCLWVRGPYGLGDVATRSVAVVGARASSAYGNALALDLAYALAENDWTVISGGAFGIDAQAHRGALGAGGVTIAVLACGIDRAYPVAHANLFDRIADEGLLVSEWPPGSRPHGGRFLIRNRLIAALARGTVVVEASARSGARQTANRSFLLGRRTMAMPGPVTSAMSVGTHQLLRVEGARLVTSAAEVIEEVGLIGDDLAPVERGPRRRRDELDPQIAQVLDAVPTRTGAGAARIAADAGVPLRLALQALPVLRQLNYVTVDDDGRYCLAGRPA